MARREISFAIDEGKRVLRHFPRVAANAFAKARSNRQVQAHIVSTAIVFPRSCKTNREVETGPWFPTSFSIDRSLQASSPTVNICHKTRPTRRHYRLGRGCGDGLCLGLGVGRGVVVGVAVGVGDGVPHGVSVYVRDSFWEGEAGGQMQKSSV